MGWHAGPISRWSQDWILVKLKTFSLLAIIYMLQIIIIKIFLDCFLLGKIYYAITDFVCSSDRTSKFCTVAIYDYWIINNQHHEKWLKWQRNKDDHLYQCSAKIRNVWNYDELRSYWHGAKLSIGTTSLLSLQNLQVCSWSISTQIPTSPTLMITLSIMMFLQTRAVWPYTVCTKVIFASFHRVTWLLPSHNCKSTDHNLTLRSSDVEQMSWPSGSYDTENITPCWKWDIGNRNHTHYDTVYTQCILTIKITLYHFGHTVCVLYAVLTINNN
jgi:hypothetical protein